MITASPEPVTESKPAKTDVWREFKSGLWQRHVNVRWFIQQNYTPYEGDGAFLAPATERTQRILKMLQDLFVEERKKSVLDVSLIPSSITAHPPGYIDREHEVIVGLQTDAPLKRAIMPNGGLRMVINSLKAYGYQLPPDVLETFTKHRKTHNEGVFDAYTPDIRNCRSSHVLTGLPDAYGRGRIIGDYRRVPLYGVARLIKEKEMEKASLDSANSTEDIIRDREELSEQIRALQELIAMARSYGYDIAPPARNAREAVQWLYFGYLAAVKEQNGAAMSLGRTSTFLDIYFERDLAEGTLVEEQAQEIIDDFVLKLRIVRFLRTPEYDELFAGDPTWVTESIAGMGDDGRPLVTKTSFRFLQTLYNLGPAPEPNLTIWYSPRLPDAFRRFAAKVSIDTSALQFESDSLMRGAWGDDGAIACCVSPMLVGKQMQFFGARANLAKCLLYAINGGRDEVTGKQVGPACEPVAGDTLEFYDVAAKFERMMEWLANVYVNAMNVIHYMHDKYAYERIEMALHDYAPVRTMAFGIAGLSVVADSLSAIRYARVKVVRDETGLVVDYQTEGDFPKFGNNDNRVDQLAASVVTMFMSKLRKYPTYRNALHTQSVLTITSNVVYGKNTGHTPDGRRKGEPFAPGANPMHGRDTHGIMAAAQSVGKIPYRDAADGISLTASMVPIRPGPHPRRSGHEPGGNARFVFRRHRLPRECERVESRDARRRDGSSGKIPAAHHPRLRLCGELRPAHAGATTGRDQPHLPRSLSTMKAEGSDTTDSLTGSPYELRIARGSPPTETSLRAALETGETGFVHSFTTGSAVDGPGVRIVAWLTGCQFRCVYCHNPDTWKMPNGTSVTLARAVEVIRKYRHGLQTMNGGLTISGGEPLMQHRFVLKVFAEAKKMGVHTALDSNGALGDRLNDDDLNLIDLVLLDIKAMTPDLHHRLTGVENRSVLEFARRLASRRRPIWIRFVLVPGWTDDPREVEQIAAFAASLGNVERVDVLPFHQLGSFKWDKLAMNYELRDTAPPPQALTQDAIERFRAAGLKAF